MWGNGGQKTRKEKGKKEKGLMNERERKSEHAIQVGECMWADVHVSSGAVRDDRIAGKKDESAQYMISSGTLAATTAWLMFAPFLSLSLIILSAKRPQYSTIKRSGKALSFGVLTHAHRKSLTHSHTRAHTLSVSLSPHL